jgi:hypothetical protein
MLLYIIEKTITKESLLQDQPSATSEAQPTTQSWVHDNMLLGEGFDTPHEAENQWVWSNHETIINKEEMNN